MGVYKVQDEDEMLELSEHDPANGTLQYKILPMANAVVGTLQPQI